MNIIHFILLIFKIKHKTVTATFVMIFNFKSIFLSTERIRQRRNSECLTKAGGQLFTVHLIEILRTTGQRLKLERKKRTVSHCTPVGSLLVIEPTEYGNFVAPGAHDIECCVKCSTSRDEIDLCKLLILWKGYRLHCSRFYQAICSVPPHLS